MMAVPRAADMHRLRWIRFGLFLAVLGLPVWAWAGAVSGTVTDAGSLVPMQGVEVLVEGSERSAVTDENGAYRLRELPPGEYVLIFQSTGYEPLKKTVVVGEETLTVDADLSPTSEAFTLAEVAVTARKDVADTAKQTVSKEEIMTLPGAGADAVRVLDSLPGVARNPVSAFATGPAIRGTSAEDSRYYVDGFDIPQLLHFGGLLTVINSEWIESLDYYAGGYSVRFGNALGGIVEINTRAPDHEKFSGVADITNYSSFVLMEAPFDKDGVWSGGGAFRRSFIDFILPAFIPEDQGSFTVVPKFWDYQAAVSWRPNPANTVRLFAYGSSDAFGLVNPNANEEQPTADQEFDFVAYFHQPTLTWTFTPSADFNNRLAFAYQNQWLDIAVFKDTRFGIGANVLHARDDVTWRPAKWNTLAVGVEAQAGTFDVIADVIRPPKEGDPSANLFNERSFRYDEQLQAGVVEGYVEDTFKIADVVNLTPGVRATTGVFDDGENSVTKGYVDPRFFTRVFATKRLTFKGSVGEYHQYPQADEMLPPFGTESVDPELAISYNAGAEYGFDGGYSLDVQGYYKQLDNLVAPTGADAEEPYNNEGIGSVYGAELLARKELTDRLYGWLAYTFSVSERRDQPGDDWRYFDQDQRHNVVVVASYRLGESWRVGGRFTYATGLPFTPIEGALYNADTDSYVPLYSTEVNSERDEAIHQLDIRVDKAWVYTNWQLTTYLDLQNVYFQKQPVGYIYNYDYTEREALTLPTFYPTLGFAARW